MYGALSLAAVLWGVLAGRPHLVVDPARITWGLFGLSLAGGVGLTVAMVILSRLSVARFAWTRELYRWFGEVLGVISRREALIFALLSSVGEELFFRGAMQPAFGLWLTTVIFGLAHLPPKRRLLTWTLSALVMGLGFGALTEATATLAGATLAHFGINYLNLLHIGRVYAESRSQGEARPPDEQEPTEQESAPR